MAFVREEYMRRVSPAKRTNRSVLRFYNWLRNTGRMHLVSKDPGGTVEHLRADLKGLIGRSHYGKVSSDL